MKPDVAMVVSTVGYHWEEVAAAYGEFKKAGLSIGIYTIDGKKPRPDPVSLKITGPLSLFGYGISKCIAPQSTLGQEVEKALESAQALSQWNTSDSKILYLPGGHGCLFDMNTNPLLHQKILELYDRGGVLSGVCHATSSFSLVKKNGRSITEGKKLTGFPHGLDLALVKLGGVSKEFLPIPFSNDRVIQESGAKLTALDQTLAALYPRYTRVDRPFVTGMGPKAAGRVARIAAALL